MEQHQYLGYDGALVEIAARQCRDNVVMMSRRGRRGRIVAFLSCDATRHGPPLGGSAHAKNYSIGDHHRDRAGRGEEIPSATATEAVLRKSLRGLRPSVPEAEEGLLQGRFSALRYGVMSLPVQPRRLSGDRSLQAGRSRHVSVLSRAQADLVITWMRSNFPHQLDCDVCKQPLLDDRREVATGPFPLCVHGRCRDLVMSRRLDRSTRYLTRGRSG
jgi:hypothetical protein